MAANLLNPTDALEPGTTPMAITVVCECGHTVKTHDHYAGKLSRCPKCRRGLRIPATEPPIVAPKVEAVAPVDDVPAFAEWKSAATDIQVSLPPLPSAASTEQTIDKGDDQEAEFDSVGFRRQFFGLWVCQLAFRFVAYFWLVLDALAIGVFVIVLVVAVIFMLWNFGAKEAAGGSFVGMAAIMWMLPTWLVSFAGACAMLAASELLNAVGWWFYRQRIGGSGPF